MSEIPGLGSFSQIVEQTENDYEVVVKTYHVPQPHQVAYWVSLGWSQKEPNVFVYKKESFPQETEPEPDWDNTTEPEND